METLKKIYPFHFNNPIDNAYMHGMYGNDYLQVEELFSVTVACFDDDLDTARKKFDAADVEGMRRIFHKIKATFGFIGMMEMQENCRQMETACAFADSLTEIKASTEILLEKIVVHRNIVDEEYKRLKLFNHQQK